MSLSTTSFYLLVGRLHSLWKVAEAERPGIHNWSGPWSRCMRRGAQDGLLSSCTQAPGRARRATGKKAAASPHGAPPTQGRRRPGATNTVRSGCAPLLKACWQPEVAEAEVHNWPCPWPRLPVQRRCPAWGWAKRQSRGPPDNPGVTRSGQLCTPGWRQWQWPASGRTGSGSDSDTASGH